MSIVKAERRVRKPKILSLMLCVYRLVALRLVAPRHVTLALSPLALSPFAPSKVKMNNYNQTTHGNEGA